MAGCFPFKAAMSDPKSKKRSVLFWCCCALVAIIMIIPALALGLVFGLRHTSSHCRVDCPGSNPNLHVDPGDTLNVNLGYSQYVGSTLGDGISRWLGIRYAAPPVGNLRFRAPADPLADGVTYQANTHAPLCHSSPSASVDPSHSEDCLFLDVYAPTNSGGFHPVFVYFQGGGFNTLSEPNLDGTSLIKAGDYDMVVVTFNYRVGPFGFLASKEVAANGTLNAGLLDQRKVLQWIQKYIHLFGGDPKHVTIGGSSAGGASVDLHLSAYGGRDDNLFHAAAAQSQSFGTQLTVAESQYQYDALVKRVKCDKSADSLQCLRNLNINAIAENNVNIPTPGGGGGNPLYMYSNVIDKNFTTDYTYNLYAQGKFVQVPVIFGDTTNEGTIFTPSDIRSYAQMNTFLKNNFPKLIASQLAEINFRYPKAEPYPGRGDYWRTAANAYGEMRYICPGIFISSAYPSRGVTQSWNYHWDVLRPDNSVNGLGVTHTSEASSIWGTSGDPEAALTSTIQSYWASFIRSKDPNTYKIASAPVWNTFDGAKMARLRFPNSVASVGMETVPADQKGRCAYLSSIGAAIAQ